MRTLHIKADIIITMAKITMVALCMLVMYMVINWSYAHITEDCDTNLFIQKLCEAVKSESIEGGACKWLCEPDDNGPPRKYDLCDINEHHRLADSMIMRSSGPVFAMRTSFFEDILKGYTSHSSYQKPQETFNAALKRSRQLYADAMNKYLNKGSHEAILNTLPAPATEPLSSQHVQSTYELVSDPRFILSYLFYGSGERAFEPPGLDTESVPAVSLENTCGGVYQSFNFANNTTPLSEVLNKSASGWSLKPSIEVLHLYEVMISLIDIEEATFEHEYEGNFYLCNLNTSMILLHNDCTRKRQSNNYMLSHECTMKVLDISKVLYSKTQVEAQLSNLRCTTQSDCRFHSCQGDCVSGRCQLSHRTQLSGLIQICELVKSIEDQVLEGANETFRGELYSIVDRCLELGLFPLDPDGSPHHLVARYNQVFQDLKLFFIKLHDIKETKLKRIEEEAAAKKEAAKQAKAKGKR